MAAWITNHSGELLRARLTAARPQEIGISAEIKALEAQLDTLAALEGGNWSGL